MNEWIREKRLEALTRNIICGSDMAFEKTDFSVRTCRYYDLWMILILIDRVK